MHDTTSPVLIVGSGPTGLTAAVSLARTGIPFRIIERLGGPNTASRAKGIQPRSLEVLDDLGAIAPIVAIGRVDMPMRFHDPSGAIVDRPTISVPANPVFASPHPDLLWIGQFSVEAALRSRLAELGAPEVEYGVEATGMEQHDDGVTVSVDTPTGPATIEASYVIGADGAHSAIRKLLGIRMDGVTVEGEPWYLGDVVTSDLDRGHMHIWTSEQGMLGLTPLPASDLWQLQSPLPHGTEPEEPSLELYQRLIDDRAGEGKVRLTAASWLSAPRGYNVRIADSYRDRRVFVAGDAAHSHSAAGGQGMNTGIQDAYNLAWKLAAVLKGEAADDLLDSYDLERRAVARGVLDDSTGKMANTAAAVTRSSEDGLADALGSIADDTTTGLPIGYPQSPLTLDAAEEDAPVRAGDRVREVSGLRRDGEPVTLFELLRGPRWTALSWGDEAAIGTDATVREFVVGRDVIDTAGALAHQFGIPAGVAATVLIRPDGYLGARITSELSGRARAYLDRWARR